MPDPARSTAAAFADLPAAAWIWSAADPDAGPQVARFRLHFPVVAQATWRGFADTSYTLWCNGVPLGAGPVYGTHTLPRLTDWDLTPHLRPGGNVLALEVWFDGRLPSISDVDPWQAGVLGWLLTPGVVIPTGPQWRACTAGSYTLARPEKKGFAAKRVLIGDLRGVATDWQLPTFDDAIWPPATVVAAHPAAPRATLRLSPMPPLTYTERRPVAVIDAGLATGDSPVTTADEIAPRMWAQTHRSLLRPLSTMTVLSTEEREGTVFGLPTPAHYAALGWPDQTAAFCGPLPLPVAAPGEQAYLCMDLGLQTSGHVWLDVASTHPLTIDLGYADHLQRGRVNPTLQGHSFADRLVLSPGRQRVCVPVDRGFRYLQCTFSAPAVLHDLWVAEHVYPHDDVRRFTCSDAALTAIWDMVAATLHQCSLTSHVDNARRERQGWGGPDLYAQAQGFFHVCGDLRLTRKMLEDFLDHHDAQGFIPNWAPALKPAVKWVSAHDLWFPRSAWDYVLHADDRELAPRLLAASETVLAYYSAQQVHGLLDRAHVYACRWGEWSMNAAQQVSTWENLLAVVAWRAVAELRRYLAQPGVDSALAEAERLTAAINAHLWHAAHGALAQGTRADGTLLDHCAQLDNAFALIHGLLPAERRAAALCFCGGPSGTWPTARSGWQGHGQGERSRYEPRRMVATGTPFGSSLCAQAIYQCVAPAEAVQYIRYNFGAMLDEGEGTLWEMWPLFMREETAATCFSQGYGAHLAATLIERVLGLTFVVPGGARLHWRPRACGLTWVAGTVATRHGAVWVRHAADGLHYQVPRGVVLVIEQDGATREVHGPATAGQPQ